MPSPVNSRVATAAAVAALTGLPVAAAAFLRVKYGPTVFDDLAAARQMWAITKDCQQMRQKNFKMIDFFESHARETPDKAFVLYEDEVHSYGGMDRESSRLARYVLGSRAVAPGDTVAIFMLNEPRFVVSWLAFNKLGLRVAFLNYNLRGTALLHCIKACRVKIIACGRDARLVETLEAILADLLALGVRVWIIGKSPDETVPNGMVRVNTWNERSEPIPRSVRDAIADDDDALYIFTSGTTGLPKAAKIPHFRQVRNSFIQAELGLTTDDVVYTSLPLYHSAAYTVGFTNVIRVGCTIALANFSARRFWDDVRQHRATVIQYIGEICRYLLAQPKRSDDGKYSHKIRYAIGNGIRPDIWEEFQGRFNIGHIAEFYGATECPYLSINMDGTVGSTGRYHGIIRALSDIIVIVRCDLETATPLRAPNGKCILTPAGETGLMLIRLNDHIKFVGYLDNPSSNEKKLVRDVKQTGDMFFNTGDLMVHDTDGQLYFKDRLGDTFRWKGENVATTEVAHTLNQYPGIQEANVYGVQVPGHDGKAGMTAIVMKKDQQLDPKSFYDHVVRSLPLYACPKFLRIMKEMDITGTFKHKKTDLAREGFDLNVISDPLFFMDTQQNKYAPLDADAMRRIVAGQAKL